MVRKTLLPRLMLAMLCVAVFCATSAAQGVKRLVVLKIDGLGFGYLDRFVKERDLNTGRSILPWFEEIFYNNGTRLPNFYSRGMSLSAPAWGQMDTGQRLQIKGNIEFDRYTLHPYDYLAVVPFYTAYAKGLKADTAAVEVLDQLKIPLLKDAFPYERIYSSNQLYQRGTSFENLAGGFVNIFPRGARDLVDEWTLGFDFRSMTVDQSERDIIGKLSKRPEIDYLDWYDPDFDHRAHHNSDDASKLAVLKKLDRALGRVWNAVTASPRFEETAVVLVSDHGSNSEQGIYSQGFNLVHLLGSRAGGGHHVVTKRRLMLDYSIKGLNPFEPLIRTASKDSYYLTNEQQEYPTAMLDFDGNERASIHLRENHLNKLHILLQQLQQLQSRELSKQMRTAAADAFFDMIDLKRPEWERELAELDEELNALHRSIVEQQRIVAALPKKYTPDQIARGDDKAGRRVRALLALDQAEEPKYRGYLSRLRSLLALRRENFDARRVSINDLMPPNALGDDNSLFDLQNYVVGLSSNGLTLAADGQLDLDRSFTRVNYFELLAAQSVRNNVQPKLSNRPVDFVAVRLAKEALPQELRTDRDAIWLHAAADKQALLLSRTGENGGTSYRYIAVAGLHQARDGKLSFETRDLAAGFPLKIFEDTNFTIPAAERAAWVREWHTEAEWLKAMHRAQYSTALIGLSEQLITHKLPDADEVAALSRDEQLLRRFRVRQRRVTEADMLILANDHWNFDVRGFNPGGNHGSFFRVSTNSTFMLAGGPKTGIPKGLVVEEPYDSLSVVPTLFALMGRIDGENRPDAELYKRGFRKFPGRVVKEVLSK